AVVLALVFGAFIDAARGVCDPLFWPCEGDPSRAAIAEKLRRTPGKHLILVRYAEDHNVHDEWVYNGADIDGAKVLWARELDPIQNAKLFAYFKDRHFWLVTPDTDNTYLEPYTPPSSNSDIEPMTYCDLPFPYSNFCHSDPACRLPAVAGRQAESRLLPARSGGIAAWWKPDPHHWDRHITATVLVLPALFRGYATQATARTS